MRRGPALLTSILLTSILLPVTAQAQVFDTAALPDADLSAVTGKFVLPNGVEIAMSVISDAAVDGRAVLRTVLSVDRGVELKVFARPVSSTDSAPGRTVVAAPAGAGAATPALSLTFDRQSGVRMESLPAATRVGATVSLTGAAAGGDPVAGAAAQGLSAVTLVPGAPAVATADGTLSLTQAAGGSVVAFNGDRFGVLQLLGQSIATATVNSADNRVLDTATDVSIDLRNVAPYAINGAMMRADTLALDATARMIR